VSVTDLPATQSYEVWLVDNVDTHDGSWGSVAPERWDRMVSLGTLQGADGYQHLSTTLAERIPEGFQCDLAVVTPAGVSPEDGGLLFGAPSLFQRLYYNGFPAPGETEKPLLWAFIVPRAAEAMVPEGKDTTMRAFDTMLQQGQQLFLNETFKGNGRTCGSCHPATNNFTLDPAFISRLPRNNPLFVAEFNPALRDLEKPALLRQFALILENVDGLDDPIRKFVMRSVPHTFALTTSIHTTATGTPQERTGWGGDGAPGNGTLREFAIGAITQHFTKRLNRVAGVDFQLPSDSELDAMEAFQLSLGRPEDIDLPGIGFISEAAKKGREIFIKGAGDPPAGGTCNGCHFNAGANLASGNNGSFNSRVEELKDVPARQIATYPCDGGFGVGPSPCGPGGTSTGFGNNAFNTPPLIEAADTPGFFHNNARTRLEDAIRFFNSPEFNAGRDPSAQFNLNEAEVTAVATMLRTLNVLENLRFSIELDQRALQASSFRDALNLVRISLANLQDGIRVLNEGKLHPEVVREMRAAEVLLIAAVATANRDAAARAIEQQKAARALLCTPGSEALLCPR
jgi:cytochrome c peroxidase